MAVWWVLVAVVNIHLVVRAIEWPLRIGRDSVPNPVVWELLLELFLVLRDLARLS